jgi:hypothetical protein
VVPYLIALGILALLAALVVVSCCVVSSRISQSKRAAATRPLPTPRPAMVRRLA